MTRPTTPFPDRAAPSAEVLWLDAVSRRYGAGTVLAPLTLRLHPGTVCLVSGDNGAGKTTLLRIAAGLLEPTSGSRTAGGAALYLRPGAAARRSQRAVDAVAFAAALAGRGAPARAAVVALAASGLPEPLWRSECGRLSAGQRARVTLAVARAVAPAVLCLDEPLEHLDADGREAVRAAVAELAAAGSAVLVACSGPGGAVGRLDAHLRLEAGRARVVG